MDTEIVTRYLRQVIPELAKVVPPSERAWRNAKLGKGKISPSTRPDLYKYIVMGQDFMPSLAWFAEELVADGDYQNISKALKSQTGIDWNWVKPYDIAIHVLEEYLLLVERLAYQQVPAQHIAINLTTFLKKQVSVLRYFSVIRGLEADFDEEIIGNGCKIRQLGDDEASALANRFPELLRSDQLTSNRLILEYTVEHKLGISDTDEHAIVIQEFERIVLALRLLRNDPLGRENTYEFYPLAGHLGVNVDKRPIHGKVIKESQKMNTYFLARNEISALMEIIDLLNISQSNSRLEIALTRFKKAAVAAGFQIEDKLLDLFIALEALYDTNQGASSYSLRMRAAKFLADESSERLQVAKLIQDGYTARSKIVHGEKYKSKDTKLKLELSVLVSEINDKCRISIVKTLRFCRQNNRMLSSQDYDDLLLA